MFFFSYCWFGLCVYWTPCRFELRKGEVIWYSNIEKQQFCKKKKKKEGKKKPHIVSSALSLVLFDVISRVNPQKQLSYHMSYLNVILSCPLSPF